PLHTFLFPLPFSLQNPRPPRISTLSLHDALPIFCRAPPATGGCGLVVLPTGRTEELMPTLTALLPALRHDPGLAELVEAVPARRSEEHTSELQSRENLVCRLLLEKKKIYSHNRTI